MSSDQNGSSNHAKSSGLNSNGKAEQIESLRRLAELAESSIGRDVVQSEQHINELINQLEQLKKTAKEEEEKYYKQSPAASNTVVVNVTAADEAEQASYGNFVCAFYFHYIADFQKSLTHASESLKNRSIALDVKAESLFLLADSQFYLESYSEAEDTFKKLQVLIEQDLQRKAHFKVFNVSQIQTKIQSIKSALEEICKEGGIDETERKARNKEEAELMGKINAAQKRGYMSYVGLPVGLVSKRWLRRWSLFVGCKVFASSNASDSQQPDGAQQQVQHSSAGVRISGSSSEQENKHSIVAGAAVESGINNYRMDEGQSKRFAHPGAVDCDDIRQGYPLINEDFEWEGVAGASVSSKESILKKGMQENHHFIVLPMPAVNVLIDTYGGSVIKRQILASKEGEENTFVEIHPLTLRVLRVKELKSSDENLKISRVYVSKKLSMSEFLDSIMRKQEVSEKPISAAAVDVLVYGDEKNSQQKEEKCRLWRSNQQLGIVEIQSQLQASNSNSNKVLTPIRIDAKALPADLTSIEDAEVEENDLIVADIVGGYHSGDAVQQWKPWRIAGLDSSDGGDEVSEDSMSGSCAHCSKAREDLFYCECLLVRYCDVSCQKSDRERHRGTCLREKNQQQVAAAAQQRNQQGNTHTNQSNSPMKEHSDFYENTSPNNNQNTFFVNNNYNGSKNLYEKQMDAESMKMMNSGLCGLQNLGNTCFLNSSLQCLSNVFELSQYMLSNSFSSDINKSNPLGTGGKLAASYAELIKEMWASKYSSVAPRKLKLIIGQFAPQFGGYNQHDSQELLSYLLDGLHEDLNRVKKKPQVEQIESDGQNDVSFAAKSWQNYLKRNQSVIVDLMVGQFKSTLICPTCSKVSVTFDPFMSISVPVPSIALVSVSVYFARKPATKLVLAEFQMKPSDTIVELKQIVAKEFGVQAENLSVYLQTSKEFALHTYSESTIVSKLNPNRSDYLFVAERNHPAVDSDVLDIQIRFFIKIWSKQKKQFENASYQRVFFVKDSTSLGKFHLKVWCVYRVYLSGFFPDLISLERTDEEQLKAEYEKFRSSQAWTQSTTSSSSVSAKYELYLEGCQMEVPFDWNSTLANVLQREPVVEKRDSDENSNLRIISMSLLTEFSNLKLNSFEDYVVKKKASSLYDCLDLFIEREVLEKGNEWYCSRCKAHVQATKKMEIFQTPQILIIHIKRFRTSRVSSIGNYYYSSGGQKLSDEIAFPVTELDLSKYVLAHSYSNNAAAASEEQKENNNDQKQEQQSQQQQQKPLLYDLFAVSNHYGSLFSGHYTASAQNPISEKWYNFNDSSVSNCSRDSIVSQGAYVLFYRRRDQQKS